MIVNKPYFSEMVEYYCTNQLEKGYIYFLRDETNGYTKIGYAKNLHARIQGIKSTMKNFGIESKCYLLRSILVPMLNARIIEGIAHAEFSKFRIFGEWFNIADNMIYDYCNKAEKQVSIMAYANEIIDTLKNPNKYSGKDYHAKLLELKKIITMTKLRKVELGNNMWQLIKSDLQNSK